MNTNEKEENCHYYNDMYTSSTNYKLSAEEIVNYAVAWNYATDIILNNNIKLVIDIGCGPGHFPEIIKKKCNINYIGIDFSETAISMAKEKIFDTNYTFIVADALQIDYKKMCEKYNVNEVLITSFEFLEHIEKDIDIINKLPMGYNFCFSVPNYKSIGHVRIFNNTNEIVKRYENNFENNLNIQNFKLNSFKIKNKKLHIIFIFDGIII
jgi:SAM-dependent methyltransferase